MDNIERAEKLRKLAWRMEAIARSRWHREENPRPAYVAFHMDKGREPEWSMEEFEVARKALDLTKDEAFALFLPDGRYQDACGLEEYAAVFERIAYRLERTPYAGEDEFIRIAAEAYEYITSADD